MIKTNGKSIGINITPDPNFDFTVCNMPEGQHRIIRGVDVCNYVDYLDNAGVLLDENGIVNYAVSDLFPTSGLYYNTSTKSYTTEKLYTTENISKFFKEPSKRANTVKNLRYIPLDLSKYKNYTYLIIVVPGSRPTIYSHNAFNDIEIVDSYYTSGATNYFSCLCFKINNYNNTQLFASGLGTNSYMLAVREYQDYQDIVKILYAEQELNHVARYVPCVIVYDNLSSLSIIAIS